MTTYGITGASGQLGRLVAEKLLAALDPAEVVLLTRTPDSLREFAERGAAVRAADFDDPAALTDAVAGVDRLLLVSTDTVGAGRRAAHRRAVDAAKHAGVAVVVYTSVPRPSAHNPAVAAHDHADTEDYLRGSGLGAVMLRNNLYADMQVGALAHAAQSGQLVTNAGPGRVAYVTREDCAAAAAAALVGDLVDGAYDITGPQALDAHDLAELAAATHGHPVEVVDVDDAAHLEGLVGAGLPAAVAEVVSTFGQATRAGLLAEVSTAVRDLTGTEPTPLRALL